MSFNHDWDTSLRSYLEDVLMMLAVGVAGLVLIGSVMAILGE